MGENERLLGRVRVAREVYAKMFENLPPDHPSHEYDYHWEAKVGHWCMAIINKQVLLGLPAEMVAYAEAVLGKRHRAWGHVEP